MDTYQPSMAPEFTALLASRAAALREVLRGETAAAAEAGDREVLDFKDIATGDTLAATRDMQADHAAHELDEIAAAQHRLADGTYGECADCGDAIDLRRLRALPATACCTSCQQAHER